MAETFPYPAEDRLYAGGLLPRQAAIPYQFLDFINHACLRLPSTHRRERVFPARVAFP